MDLRVYARLGLSMFGSLFCRSCAFLNERQGHLWGIFVEFVRFSIKLAFENLAPDSEQNGSINTDMVARGAKHVADLSFLQPSVERTRGTSQILDRPLDRAIG